MVEDDESIARGLRRALEAQGWFVESAADGRSALAAAGSIDLVLLDLGLPDMDGVDVCRTLHATEPTLPVIMLTARSEEVDVVIGLDSGAVDYVTKPFRLAELIARVRAHLRQVTAAAADQRIVAGDVTVDIAARRAWLYDTELDLRAKEFDVLALLVREAGQVVTRDRFMAELWDEHWYGSTKTLDVHIAAVRRKLGELSSEGSRISTLRGVGYRFEKS